MTESIPSDMTDVVDVMENMLIAAESCNLGDEFIPIVKRLWINDADLIPEYRDQAALFAYVASQHGMRKVDLDEKIGVISLQAREGLEEEGKKITEGKVNALVDSDPAVVRLRKQVQFLGALSMSFEHKKQMLIGIGADLREEQRATEMSISRKDQSGVLDNMVERAKAVIGKKQAKKKKSSKPMKLKKKS